MHIDRNAEDLRKAQRLHAILKRCYAAETDNENRSIIAALEQQLESRLTEAGVSHFSPAGNDVMTKRVESPLSPGKFIMSLWHFIAGPGHREEELSKQRRELMERAEHAETSAFEALAESAELKKTLDQALRKIHKLETELGRKPGNN